MSVLLNSLIDTNFSGSNIVFQDYEYLRGDVLLSGKNSNLNDKDDFLNSNDDILNNVVNFRMKRRSEFLKS